MRAHPLRTASAGRAPKAAGVTDGPFRESPLPPRPVYVEHCNPHVPSKVVRYADVALAVEAVRWTLRLGTAQPIREAFAAGKTYWWGLDSWRIVLAAEFEARAVHARLMCARMDAGEDVDDLQG